MTARGALLGCALSASLLGCAPHTDCSRLLDGITPGLARIKETLPTTTEPPSAADLRATSVAYVELASVVEHLQIPEGRVKALASHYQEIAVELAAGYEVLARALEADDTEKLLAAKTALDRGGKNERQLMQQLGGVCAAP